MPSQTTMTSQGIMDADGAKVEVKESGASVYTEIGVIEGDITAVLNFDVSDVQKANAQLARRFRNQSMAISFTMNNLIPANIAKMGGGMFTTVVTAGTAVTTSPNQTIAAGWTDNTLYDLDIVTSSSDDTPLRMTSANQPTLTSVTLDPSGTPEVLVEDADYVVVYNPNSRSNWSIQFISGNMDTVSPTTFEIVIDYASVTPIANTTLHAGSSVGTLAASSFKFTHTDSAGKARILTVHEVNPDAGFNFDFKGADTGGNESMVISGTGYLDGALTDGQQLFSWAVEEGAV